YWPSRSDPVPGLNVMANISLSSDLSEVRGVKAEGVGLYRTEFEFMASRGLLDEDEQYEHYAAVLKAMDGAPVYFRLADLGGDKPLPFLELPKEENPYLGCRGSRLLLGHPDLLRTQARALARASVHGPVHVMYPMVVDLEQFLKLKSAFQDATRDISAGEIKHGVMFEVPSACMQAREILDVADFGSIGSNDLIQYLFAVDRNNELVAGDYRPDRPVFWTLVRQIVEAAKSAGKDLSLCGELAGDSMYIPKLVDAGVTRISVSPRLVGGVRRAAKAFFDE
ncbi:putative PEP-binding protein, partial [Planctomycetota bacterium]